MLQKPNGLAACFAVVLLAGCNGSQTSVVVPPTAADAARLMEQATFGPTEAGIAEIQASSAAAYIDQQLTVPATGYPGIPVVDTNSDIGCPTGSINTCYRDKYTLFPIQTAFFRNALTGNDQLRQRVGFALSQILVASGSEINLTHAMAAYQQILLDGAFGSYRQLLERVTLNPVMGRFLDMLNNNKGNNAGTILPNENYAREILQLFSIGEVQLNDDGTAKLDGQGNPIPTYDPATIQGYARVFTGWTYPTKPGATPKFYNPSYFVGDMQAIAANHEAGTKLLLNGVTLPAGQTQAKDLADALDSIANHPNVGPFIGKQLIQQLVTSNPSPAYVARVTAVFNNDGNGQRGNLGAVVKAILLDAEARGDVKTDASYGKLREPALLLAGALRAVGGTSDGVHLRDRSFFMSENIYQAPSVFNFYPPDYPIQGTQLVGPTFGIFDANTAFTRINWFNSLLNAAVRPDASVPNSIGTQFDFTAWLPLGAATDPAALLDRINVLLFHGSMSAASRNTILAAVSAIPATDPTSSPGRTRVRAALYLALSSDQYQVEQ